MSRIGIDLDGVLCDFVRSFNALAKAEFNVDLPYPAPCWDHHEGYITKEQHRQLWEIIKSSPFQGSHMPLPGAVEALQRLNTLGIQGHSIYFITSRSGDMAKFWSEMWLKLHGMDLPTVLIAEQKGPVVKGLNLDVFVDDKPENNLDVINETGRTSPIPGGGLLPNIRVYLIDQPWNQWADQPFNYGIRVADLNEVLEREFPQSERRAA